MALNSFFSLPETRRMAIYSAVKAQNCQTYSREGSFLGICVARQAFQTLVDAMRDHGLEYRHLSFFPVGTDNPPQHLRHDANYPGSSGFYMVAWFTPAILNPEAPAE